MAYKSKQNGIKGESIVVNLFRTYGYWTHLVQRNRSGSQPVDIIAIKEYEDLDGRRLPRIWLIDAKYVERGDRFDFNDIQPNQIESLRYAKDFAKIKRNAGFGIIFGEFDEQVYFLPLDKYEEIVANGGKSVHRKDMQSIDYIEGLIECKP